MLVLEFMIDKSNPNWGEGNNKYMCMLLSAAEAHFNNKYQLKGRVTLDEVLDYLEIPIPPGLGFYGWDKEFDGDKHIDFGFRDQIKEVSDGEQDFVFLRFNINTDKEVTS